MEAWARPQTQLAVGHIGLSLEFALAHFLGIFEGQEPGQLWEGMDILKQGYPDIEDSQLEEILREADGDVFEALDVLRISFGEPGIGKAR